MHYSLKSNFLRLAIDELQGIDKRQPTYSELNKYFVECGSTWTSFDPTVNWCGVFAAYLLRKAGAKIRWVMGWGIHNLTGTENPEGNIYVQMIYGNKGISIGDIAVRDSSNHHFIVLTPPDNYGNYKCVEGNYGGVGNPWLHHGWNYKNNISRVNLYYRILF